MPSYVTDRPVPVAVTSATPSAATESEVDEEINPAIEIPYITIAQSSINYGASTSQAPPAVIPANKQNVSISPHEKLNQGKSQTKAGKKRSSAILIDTPVKKKLEEEKINAAAKKGNVKIDSSEDDSCSCLVCGDAYEDSPPNEKWIQCTICREWAFGNCGRGTVFYVCENCDADEV
ncbi:hypothetical protein J6590_036604 [Homalodisca vitripennis]|nr:hypothetical protein J6590_036604 [Homalodisca vitripennis]